jgi:hypothetical protein
MNMKGCRKIRATAPGSLKKILRSFQAKARIWFSITYLLIAQALARKVQEDALQVRLQHFQGEDGHIADIAELN